MLDSQDAAEQAETKNAAAKLSPNQIQRARQNPNTIIFHALATAAAIQKTLDEANYKIEKLIKQKQDIRDSLDVFMSKEQQNTES